MVSGQPGTAAEDVAHAPPCPNTPTADQGPSQCSFSCPSFVLSACLSVSL